MRIALVMLLSAGVGVLLAGPWIDWPLHEGYIGVLLMVGAALYMRRHWQQRAERRGDEPGEPEREVWHGLASTSLIGAQVTTALVLAGPGLSLHSATTQRLGVTAWTLVAGAVVSWYLLHRREVRRDERDRAIDARASYAAHTVLAVLIVIIAVSLGLNPPQRLPAMSHVFLGHVLLLTLVASSLVRHVLQLCSYQRDTADQTG
jgi:cytochrome c oxidase assembly factor CtaG